MCTLKFSVVIFDNSDLHRVDKQNEDLIKPYVDLRLKPASHISLLVQKWTVVLCHSER